MGTDITTHVEVLTKNGWIHYSKLAIKRHYKFFSELASVRGDSEILGIKEFRGLPSDITEATLFDLNLFGNDDCSWISSSEYLLIYHIPCGILDDDKDVIMIDKEADYFGYFYGNLFSDFALKQELFYELSVKGVLDFRFVFWFDS